MASKDPIRTAIERAARTHFEARDLPRPTAAQSECILRL